MNHAKMHHTLLSLLLLAHVSSAADPAPKVQARALEEHMQAMIENATPSIVAVVVSYAKYPALPAADRDKPGRLGSYTPAPAPAERFFPRVAPLDKLDLSEPANMADNPFGSGIVLDEKAGTILTTHHLIEGATKVYVRTSAGKGSYADIVAADARADLAVLRLIDRVAGLKSAKLGTAQLVQAPNGDKPNLKRGSWIIALGHPLATGFKDGTPSASWGILANIRQRSAPQPIREDTRPKPLHAYGSLLQTDARVTLGSSGSALLNMDGEIIGIASTVAAVGGNESNGGFAIPLEKNYRRIIELLESGKEVEYGFLGVAPSTERGGVMINSVTAGCPAALAGLKAGDTIVSVDGHSLTEQDDLLLYVGGAIAGSKVSLEIRRAGRVETEKKDVVLAKMANPLASIVTVPSPSYAGLRVDHSSIRLLQLFNTRIGLNGNPPAGVCVREIEPNSPAEKCFKEAGESVSGWLITMVDGKAISTPDEFHAAMARKANVKLTLADPLSPSKTTTITLP